MAKTNIAIDGPAGAGKSTIAKRISDILGIIYIDTGAMYRAVALKAINTGVYTTDAKAVEALIKNTDIKIDYKGNEQRIFLDDADVTELIRTAEVSLGASNIAIIPAVRIKLAELQRNIAEVNDVVMDGREIGTYVLPEANYKFFLTASIEERAKRRYNELLAKGYNNTEYEDVLKDISYRDKNDSSRAFAPLLKADDAIEIDTTNLSLEQVLDTILSYIK